MPATKTFVLLPGTTGRASVFRQVGLSPAGLNWTNTVPADDGGTLCGAALNWYTGLAPTSAAVAVQVTRSPTRTESSLGASVAVPDSRRRFSRASIGSRAAWHPGDGRTDDNCRRDFRELGDECSHI